MTAHEQLRTLWRQFPRATELAVSQALVDVLEEELVTLTRFRDVDASPCRTWPRERLRDLTAQRLPLTFRSLPLVRVESA